MNKKQIIPIAVFFVITTLACNLLSPGGIQQAVKDLGKNAVSTAVMVGQGTAEAVAETAIAGGTTPEEAATPEAPVSEPGAPPPVNSLSNLAEGVDKLDSYKLVYEIRVQGKDDQGNDQTGSLKFEEARIRASGDNSLKMSAEGSMASGTPGAAFETYQVGGVLYMVTGGDQPACTSMTSSDTSTTQGSLLQATNFVSNMNNLNLVERGVDVNGIKTDHYSFDEKSMASASFSSAKGDIWLAQEGGFVAKMVGTATGTVMFMTSGTGTMDWSYELTSVNQLQEITLPDFCSAPAGTSGEIPIPDNATDQSSIGQMVTFKSPDSPKAVYDYYLAKMAELGWQVDTQTEMDPVYMVTFKKEAQTLNVTISGDASGTSVMIIKGP